MNRKKIDDIIVRKKTFNLFQKKEETIEPEKINKENLLFLRPKISYGRKIKYFLFLAIAVVLGGGFYITSKLSSMTVHITPVQKTFFLEGKFDITESKLNSVLAYKTAKKTTNSMSVEGFATETRDSGGKASGKIMIFNNSSSAQNLVGHPTDIKRQTRFETPEGKIFRIRETVRVPARRGATPGSAEATIYAEEEGEEYNVGRVDFKIPGLKGTPQYDNVYARSVDSIQGGFVGKAVFISKEDYDKAKKELVSKLEREAVNSIVKEIPDDFILYKTAYKIEINEEESNPDLGTKIGTESSSPKESFVLKGVASIDAYLLPKKSLSDAIVGKINSKGEINSSEVTVSNMESLEFSFLSIDKENKKIFFSLTGQPHIVWNIDKESLSKDLIENKEEPAQIFKKYSNIDKASIVYRPSWWKTPPKDHSRIFFEEEISQ